MLQATKILRLALPSRFTDSFLCVVQGQVPVRVCTDAIALCPVKRTKRLVGKTREGVEKKGVREGLGGGKAPHAVRVHAPSRGRGGASGTRCPGAAAGYREPPPAPPRRAERAEREGPARFMFCSLPAQGQIEVESETVFKLAALVLQVSTSSSCVRSGF